MPEPSIESMGLIRAIQKATTHERLDDIRKKLWGWHKAKEVSIAGLLAMLEDIHARAKVIG